MLKTTKEKMLYYAYHLQPSAARAQCIKIANYELEDGETIAARIARDHSSADGALRAATLMESAGCAKEIKPIKKHCYEIFTFEDGSSF